MCEREITTAMLESFRQELTEGEKSRATIEKYMRDIQSFLEFAEGRSIDKSLVLSYKNSLKENYAMTSANSMLASLNTLMRFNDWHDCCVKQFKIQKKAYCSEEAELTKQEYIHLVKTAESSGNERLSLILQTICATGIRISELEYVTVESLRTGEAIVSCKGKIRTVFLVKELRHKLMEYAEKRGVASGAVFVTRGGNPVNRSNIWREMKALCDAAGVPTTKVFPHNLRHLFARTFYDMEKDISQLADILGHTNINTTRIYIITTGEEHKRKMEGMELTV